MGILRPFYVDSPSTWDDQDDGLDFSSDPDQRHAKLPQPFRLVNKILDCLFEDTWASITTRQALKESQANFSQLPNLEGGIKVNLPYKLHNVCSTPDNELVIGVGEGGLLAFSHDDVTRPIFKFNIDGGYLKANVTSGPEEGTYVVAALDEKGMITLFGITRAGFIEVSQLSNEGDEKVLHFWLNGSNLALSVGGEKDSCSILFYQLPITSWSEPFEQISSQRLQGSDEDNSQFTAPELKGRVSSPSSVSPCAKNNLSEAITPIMNTITNPVRLGQGTHHILPSSYFENRRAMLEKLPKYKDVDWSTVDSSVIRVGHVVFMQDNKVMVWWTNHHIATLHSLATDVETVVDSFIYCSDITSAASSCNGDKVAIGLQKGLTSVIDMKECLTVQCSLVSRSPVNHVVFVEDKLLAACQDGAVAVLSCDVENSCARIQHIRTDNKALSVSQIYPLPPFSNLAVVTLCPGKVAVIDVDSYRAIAIVPAWTDSVPICASLTKKYLCVISLDTVLLSAKIRALHKNADCYLQNVSDNVPEVSELFVYEVSDNSEIIERGYVNTGENKQSTLSGLCQSYIADRESKKCARHERLRERWFQYTEELETY